MPEEDDSADFVFAFDSLDHWQDVQQGFSEIRRVLRPGGRLMIVKDGAVPGATKARRELEDILGRAGFRMAEQRELSAEGVSFTLWAFLEV